MGTGRFRMNRLEIGFMQILLSFFISVILVKAALCGEMICCIFPLECGNSVQEHCHASFRSDSSKSVGAEYANDVRVNVTRFKIVECEKKKLLKQR